jgi:PD-(D/E)XK endonuclease
LKSAIIDKPAERSATLAKKHLPKPNAAEISAELAEPAKPSQCAQSTQQPPSPKPRRKNTKRTGELSEAAFLLKAQSLGFKVAKPWGDSERYDFILDNGERLWRVQVKCTAYLRLGGYDIQPVHTDQTHKAAYTADDIDFLVAHIIPLDLWYVVPVEALGPGMSLRFYPDGNCPRARFEQYREAWRLLRPGGQGKVQADPQAESTVPSVDARVARALLPATGSAGLAPDGIAATPADPGTGAPPVQPKLDTGSVGNETLIARSALPKNPQANLSSTYTDFGTQLRKQFGNAMRRALFQIPTSEEAE